LQGKTLGDEMQKKGKNVLREYFELIAETAVFVFFVMTFVVQAFQISYRVDDSETPRWRFPLG
jgi:hypothetical protein